MKKLNYFFKRKEFTPPKVKQPFYKYLGYVVQKRDGKKIYPISIYFGKDELSVSFTDVRGQIHKIFSLYVAEGELNQKKLSSQIENYWKMPIWPLKKDVAEILKDRGGSEAIDLHIDHQLLSSGVFGKYFGINITDDHKFVEDNLFKDRGKKKDFEIINDGLQIRFFYKKDSEEIDKEEWKLDKDKEIITTNKIDFRKILLDFLFELEFASTFEDKNFFQLQPVLQDNKVLDALTKECTYLLELYHLKNHQQETKKPKLPLKFRNAEKEWLNVCFLESYQDVFASRKSIFRTTEEEVELVLFKTRIGASSRDRSKLFTKDDVSLRNRSATFFLRKYSIYSAFRTLLHPSVIYLLPVLLLLIPFGDFCLNMRYVPDGLKQLVGLSSIGIPIMMLVALIVYYSMTGINLFKLALPRLFLGIMLGWSVFWSTGELWKTALIGEVGRIFVVNLVLFVLIYLYIFTDIRNKLIKLQEGVVFRKAGALVLFAMLISFVQGFYVLQFMAKPMLETSGFLTSDNPKLFDQKNVSEIKNIEITGIEHLHSRNSLAISKITHKVNSKDHKIIILESGCQKERKMLGIKNFSIAKLFTGTELYYIWSIHLSQFMVSILIGIVLQLLWEDRPITEPL